MVVQGTAGAGAPAGDTPVAEGVGGARVMVLGMALTMAGFDPM
jgi:hypothetical protein